jgi:hypothetical protein
MVNMDIDTQAGVGQNKLPSGGVSYFPSSSACERVGPDRPIHLGQTHDRRFHERPKIRFWIETI